MCHFLVFLLHSEANYAATEQEADLKNHSFRLLPIQSIVNKSFAQLVIKIILCGL